VQRPPAITDPATVKWIAAVSPGGLGDTILFSPVLKALRTCYPTAFIELITANALVPEIYSATGIINAITVANTNHPWWRPGGLSTTRQTIHGFSNVQPWQL